VPRFERRVYIEVEVVSINCGPPYSLVEGNVDYEAQAVVHHMPPVKERPPEPEEKV
jgi:hypothetical protein